MPPARSLEGKIISDYIVGKFNVKWGVEWNKILGDKP